MGADLQPDLRFQLPEQDLRWVKDFLEFVKVLKFKRDHWRDKQIGTFQRRCGRRSQSFKFVFTKPNYYLRIQVVDQSSDQSFSHSDSISFIKPVEFRSASDATTGCPDRFASLECLISGMILKVAPL